MKLKLGELRQYLAEDLTLEKYKRRKRQRLRLWSSLHSILLRIKRGQHQEPGNSTAIQVIPKLQSWLELLLLGQLKVPMLR
ncbi:hypothetical protein J433_11227 [Corynebacterium glutamicum MT]|uniref:Uncharacterized protein n=1 Tax=Corynebacterium glutamicum TaxID=1718 RepID=A0AB36ICW5_CORGT|nr:hypothetical protein C624_00070 [Corynebacterium glutamicum SCgG1]AGN20632.1 hypothetical protein C629_00070 [Corynebacterium glutamicum SCgG2]EGV41219.1 hypothetical protein CgS9114_04420 [Corynebacterium glutamicum S9114]EOA63971.1 hypothetical protein J433_11227 [Corynebacterium glutamicum MT]EPP39348.1 hypothetical protein A583_14868 [Corynebacterium glutamicum Z188]OKX79619.1 hypothetical protein AUP70_06180 [Corynebacterium glutamicum]